MADWLTGWLTYNVSDVRTYVLLTGQSPAVGIEGTAWITEEELCLWGSEREAMPGAMDLAVYLKPVVDDQILVAQLPRCHARRSDPWGYD